MKNTLSLVRILYDPTRIDRQVKVVNCWLLFPLMRPLRLVIMEVIRGSFCEAGPGLNSLTSSAIPESKDWFKLKCIPKFFYILLLLLGSYFTYWSYYTQDKYCLIFFSWWNQSYELDDLNKNPAYWFYYYHNILPIIPTGWKTSSIYKYTYWLK